jgi:uncharacterized protein YhfF
MTQRGGLEIRSTSTTDRQNWPTPYARLMSDDRDSRYVTPLGEADPAEVSAFWSRFLSAAGLPSDRPAPAAWCFGHTVELADELIELVINGPKQATAGAVADYEAESEPLPTVGTLSVVTDGSMRPRAVIETTDVRVGPLSSVDDAFAWDEGEGDRTRAGWLDAHTWYFSQSLARIGQVFHPDIQVVFERFVLRYHEGFRYHED